MTSLDDGTELESWIDTSLYIDADVTITLTSLETVTSLDECTANDELTELEIRMLDSAKKKYMLEVKKGNTEGILIVKMCLKLLWTIFEIICKLS